MKTTLKLQIDKINKMDIFSPYFFLPFILLLYLLTSLFDFHRFELFQVNTSIWPPVFIGLASYYIGVYVVDKKGWTFPNFGLSFLRGYTIHVIWLIGLIGLVAYTTMAEGNFGITGESVRRSLDPKLDFLSQLLWFAVLLLISIQLIRDKNITKLKLLMYGTIYGAVMVLFLIMDYQTPIIIMLFTGLAVYHYVVKRIKLTWFLSTLLVISIFFSLFGFFRVILEDPTAAQNSREQPDVQLTEQQARNLRIAEEKVNDVPKWIRSLNDDSVTGHIVLSKIIEYTKEEGYLKGEIHRGIYQTLLSGKQTSPRMKVTEVVNSLSVQEGKYITRPTRTTTPTYIGQLFLDGGYFLVIFGFLLYGVIISLLYNQAKHAGNRSYQSVAFAFVMTIFTVSMHTGLLDLIFILMICFVIFTASINHVKPDTSN